ncbi:Similar to hypothetical protein [Tuber melanosporum Mel28]; acc. no. XP_002840937 [Pyronema omphalodes CBS 100304]|uniref:Uncharacterized protein n=1 Tax=Pyronema omphalodes (strain CBS 100304) TaxID=1076935 RepID=U4LKQ8_PYROM|nr:Similar to hypothetical protein [Tuber melanosporum Mel28]; acc. no. XP_002840937 [Pyronema omphalodes CBS 100304]
MSLKDGKKWSHGPFLCGFDVGNATYPKIITTNPDVKIHSCERNTDCEALNRPNVVYITPVVAVINGELWQEDGIDYGDLNNNEDFSNPPLQKNPSIVQHVHQPIAFIKTGQVHQALNPKTGSFFQHGYNFHIPATLH